MAAMLMELTIEANDGICVVIPQHGGNDITIAKGLQVKKKNMQNTDTHKNGKQKRQCTEYQFSNLLINFVLLVTTHFKTIM